MASPGASVLPALRPGCAVIAMGEGVQIRLGDEEVHVLRTEAPARLATMLAALDGRHERDEVLSRLGPGGAHELDEVLSRLAEAGLLSAVRAPVTGNKESHGGADRRGNDDVVRYLAHALPASEDPAAGLRGARVTVFGNGQCTALLTSLLEEHGIGASPSTIPAPATGPETATSLAAALRGTAEVLVCIWEAPDLARCLAVNEAACRARLPCLFVDLSHGRHATVGPFFVPGEGACYRCLRTRLHESTAAFAELSAAEAQMVETGEPLAAFGCLPAHRHLVCGLAAAEVVALLAGHRPLRTLGRAITVGFERLEMWSEPVWRVPWCAACR